MDADIHRIQRIPGITPFDLDSAFRLSLDQTGIRGTITTVNRYTAAARDETADGVRRCGTATARQLGQQRVHPNHQHTALAGGGNLAVAQTVEARRCILILLFVTFLLTAEQVVDLAQAELFFGCGDIEIISTCETKLLRELLHAD